jgi:hypothetical protein
MPKLKCESKTARSPQEAFAKLKALLESDRDLRAMDSSYRCQFDEATLSGTAKGNKFEAEMKIAPAGEGANVAIEVSLPLMLTPLKGIVQSTLQKKMDKALA